MRIHILGICGTFMGGLALLARERGDVVSGCDEGIYPPMSEQLAQAGITLHEGFDAAQLDAAHDAVVVGNAMTRGNPCVERLLDEKRALESGPSWLAQHVLRERKVLAVAGTHGKTTTASMLAWILEANGDEPGFLIGGVPGNFGVSARLGAGEAFVVEADEYDSAFFDKRSKFVHYRADAFVVNNLEFDHADIFRDLADVQRQFHHAVRLVPRAGAVIAACDDDNVDALLEMGCFSELVRFGAQSDKGWGYSLESPRGDRFQVLHDGEVVATVAWSLIGRHNVMNALGAIAAAAHVGVSPERAGEALSRFVAPRRRLERVGSARGVTVYDDFAHHPTAIRSTLQAMRSALERERIIAVVDPASNTMRMGVHAHTLGPALAAADRVVLHNPSSRPAELSKVCADLRDRSVPVSECDSVRHIIESLCATLDSGDHVVIMSNAGFEGIHQRLIEALSAQ